MIPFFRFQVKSQEKCAVSKLENYISEGGLGFDHNAGTTVHGSGGFHSQHGNLSLGQEISIQHDMVAQKQGISSPTKNHV